MSRLLAGAHPSNFELFFRYVDIWIRDFSWRVLVSKEKEHLSSSSDVTNKSNAKKYKLINVVRAKIKWAVKL